MRAGAHIILTFQQVSSTRGGKQTVEDDEEDADEEYVEKDAEEEAAGDAEQLFSPQVHWWVDYWGSYLPFGPPHNLCFRTKMKQRPSHWQCWELGYWGSFPPFRQ